VHWRVLVHPKTLALQERLLDFAARAVKFCDALPPTPAARKIGGQLIDSSSGSYGNYRSACRARSRAEFIAKLGVVLEELDESEGWFRLLVRAEISTENATRELSAEVEELVRIFAASILTSKGKRS
jgi:four helix bundle protein